MSAKAAPKTLNQVRNVCYICAVWFGLQKGFSEKTNNDYLWAEHQKKLRRENLERMDAAHALEAAKRDAQLEKAIPEIVPAELHEIYKTLEGN